MPDTGSSANGLRGVKNRVRVDAIVPVKLRQ